MHRVYLLFLSSAHGLSSIIALYVGQAPQSILSEDTALMADLANPFGSISTSPISPFREFCPGLQPAREP